MSNTERANLEALEQERRDLPLEHFGARMRAAGAQIAAEQGRIEELRPEAADAREEYERLEQEAAEAARRAEEARVRMAQLEGAIAYAEGAMVRQGKLLDQIEAEGPREL